MVHYERDTSALYLLFLLKLKFQVASVYMKTKSRVLHPLNSKTKEKKKSVAFEILKYCYMILTILIVLHFLTLTSDPELYPPTFIFSEGAQQDSFKSYRTIDTGTHEHFGQCLGKFFW